MGKVSLECGLLSCLRKLESEIFFTHAGDGIHAATCIPIAAEHEAGSELRSSSIVAHAVVHRLNGLRGEARSSELTHVRLRDSSRTLLDWSSRGDDDVPVVLFAVIFVLFL